MADYFYNPYPAPGISVGSPAAAYISENNFTVLCRFNSKVDHSVVAPAADITSGFISTQINLSSYKRIRIKNIFSQNSILILSPNSQDVLMFNNINLLFPTITYSIGFHSGAFNPVSFTDNNQNLFIPPVVTNTSAVRNFPNIPVGRVDIPHNIISNTFLSIIGGFHSPFLYTTDYATQYANWITACGLTSISSIFNLLSISIQGEIY
jgi:hypothetical protein